MTIFKAGDKVRIKRGAYNVSDHRFGMTAKVTRIDTESILLPVRVEYDSFQFNWTNHESLELVEAAPSEHAAIGKDILDKMVTLKESIVARDNAVKLVVEQTEALDALLTSVGLKRGEEIPAVPVRVTAKTRTVLDDVTDGSITLEGLYKCTSSAVDFFTKDKTYRVEDLDLGDRNQPVSFIDDDGDEMFPDRPELAFFVRVI
jgi:hypothetical protein